MGRLRFGDDVLRRPAFWDGENRWRVRFAAPYPGDWEWVTEASVDDTGLAGRPGTVTCLPDLPRPPGRVYEHGFWRMSPSGRQLVHEDGTPALMVADTAWALPLRATPEQVEVYARDRQAKGFNAVLLMTVQPDMRAVGPRDRTLDEGFDVGFEDLPDGRLRELNPGYFGRLDVLLDILLAHDLVPVLQPVFQGFGWKGLDVAGKVVPPDDYARYCRYLVARYGARPAVYLVGADGTGRSRRWRPAARRSTPGTPTASPPASTTGRTPPTTPTRTPTGWTSRAARPATTPSTSRSGWPTCGATPRPRAC